MCWYNRCFWQHSWCCGKKQSAFSPSTFTSRRHSTSSFQGCTRRKLDPISHICTLLCTYLTWRILCFLNILLELQKETKGTENKNKKRECTALQECPLSLRRFLELTGFLLIVIDHHWWTLNEDVIIHQWTWYGKWLLMGGMEGGTQGAWKKGKFSFFSSEVENENKESSTVFQN